MPRLPLLAAVALAVPLLMGGCDLLGVESPEKVAAAREAEGKAVGAACRHAGRAIEDCYALNRRTEKAAIFAGWRDMNDYMRENKIDAVPPVLVAQGPAAAKAADGKADTAKPADAKPAEAEAGSKPKPKEARTGS